MNTPLDIQALANDPTCTRCSLHETPGNTNICIPMRKHTDWDPELPTLLIVGEAPGYKEDHENKPFVGPAGHILKEVYLRGTALDKLANIYLTNAVRCRPPGNRTPSLGQLKTCLPYLANDLVVIHKRMANPSKPVYVLCVGASAARTMLGMSLTDAFHHQGIVLDQPVPHRVYSTYHPAYLLAGRNPSAITSVEDHLHLLQAHLLVHDLGAPTTDASSPGRNGRNGNCSLATTKLWHTPESDTIISLDIETYGMVKGPEQRYFHPRKSEYWDGIRPQRQIKSVACTYRQPGMKGITNSVCRWADLSQRRDFLRFLRVAVQSNCIILGQNILYDILYLRHCHPAIKAILNQTNFKLIDLQVYSYLDNEQRPEKSLKALTPLFGGIPYTEAHTSRHASDTEPLLFEYNAIDTHNTLFIYRKLLDRIREHYDQDTADLKLSATTCNWFSDLLWTVLYMTESGVTFNRAKLEGAYAHNQEAMAKCHLIADEQNFKLSGKGSQAEVDGLVEECVRHIPDSEQHNLELSTVNRKISANNHNFNIFLEHLNPQEQEDLLKQLQNLMAFRSHQKLVTTYYKPMLEGRTADDRASSLIRERTRQRGLLPFDKRRRVHRVYPSWFIVPSALKDDHGKEGGVVQGRFSATQPAIQTIPPAIDDCRASRFGNQGILLSVDYSQIEYRVAGFLSNDTEIRGVYDRNEDYHAITGALIWRIIHPNRSSTTEEAILYRQLGKTLNFLVLFRGGSNKFRATIENQVGESLSKGQAHHIIDVYWKKHPELHAWQEELIRGATDLGYVALQPFGQSRRFALVTERDHSTIVNFPVQLTAALICQSAQIEIQHEINHRKLVAYIPHQCHDAIYFDVPLYNVARITAIIKKHSLSNPVLTALESHYGRPLKVAVDLKVKVTNSSGVTV